MSVVIETTVGDITVDLFTEERPVACLNFMKLCKLKYFNFNLFHTVEQGFIAQTGDPTGFGDGGSSVWGVVEGLQKRFFEAETLPKINHTSAGLLSLVSAGKNLVGSQFFFTLADNLTSLDGIHCVIGEVVEGHETLRKLNDAIVDEKFRPYQDIRITHTVILDDPFPNPRGFQVPSRSPSPSAERLQNGRIAADEDIDDTDGKTMEELQEMLSEREAQARATILEIVGDLPDADMAPPENVLFVCKLNPVTTDDDLEIIFSRFGVVKNCEVIRDRKTGDSLQYAFVEFEEQKSCEAAFFKMDNVLIDDRRIHVDFSQSVAKVKWRGKGRGVLGPEGRLNFNNLRDNGEARKERYEGENFRHKERSEIGADQRQKAREERHRKQRSREVSREQRYGRQRDRDSVRSNLSRSQDLSQAKNIRCRDKSPLRKDEHLRFQKNIDRKDCNWDHQRYRRKTPERRRASHEQICSTDRRERDKWNKYHQSEKRENIRTLKHESDDKHKLKKSKRSGPTGSEDSSSSTSRSDSSSSSTESNSSMDSSSNGRRKQKKSKTSKHSFKLIY